MSGRIPEAFIQDLLARVDIVEVIGSRIELKPAGREFRALSPFTNEKSPSFFVSPAKQMFFDFSSGKNGTALSFLMEHERLEFVEAVEELAKSVGLEVPREGGRGPSRAVLEGPLDAMALATRFYRQCLREAPAAVEYLKQRGVDGDTAKAFGIGFAPDGWDALTRQFQDPRHAIDAGLLIEKDGGRGVYDRFRNRIMFPIRDNRGRVIAFGGRTMGNDPAKYLNSPETELFHKGRQLYGLYEARQANPHPPVLYVVEGYMDVVGLALHGVPAAVATLGTATTPEHLRLLFRATSRVVFCFDGDAAGQRAAWKALEQSLPELGAGREVAFMFLPAGEDPDTFIARQGKAAWDEAAAAALPLGRFLIDSLAKQADLSSPDGRARLASLAQPHLARIDDAAVRAALINDLEKRTRFSRPDLEAMMRSAVAPEPTGPAAGGRVVDPRRKPVGRALQLLLEHPELAAEVSDIGELANASIPGLDLLVTVIEYLIEHPGSHAAGLIQGWPDADQARLLGRLATPTEAPGSDDPGDELKQILSRLRDRARRQRAQELLDAAASRSLSAAETAELRALTSSRSGAKLSKHGRN
jgi:DNA primase